MSIVNLFSTQPQTQKAPHGVTRASLSELILSVETDPLAGKGFLTQRELKLDRLLAHIRVVMPEFDRDSLDQIMTLIEQDPLMGKGYLSESELLIDRIMAKARLIKSGSKAEASPTAPVIVLNTEAPKGK